MGWIILQVEAGPDLQNKFKYHFRGIPSVGFLPLLFPSLTLEVSFCCPQPQTGDFSGIFPVKHELWFQVAGFPGSGEGWICLYQTQREKICVKPPKITITRSLLGFYPDGLRQKIPAGEFYPAVSGVSRRSGTCPVLAHLSHFLYEIHNDKNSERQHCSSKCCSLMSCWNPGIEVLQGCPEPQLCSTKFPVAGSSRNLDSLYQLHVSQIIFLSVLKFSL